MAWNAPRTWVDEEIVTFTVMNQHVRDNFLVLDTHPHDGSSGGGSSSLGDLVKGTFTDAAAPAAPGAGLTAIYAVAGIPHFRAGAGGSDLTMSETTHTHTPANDAQNKDRDYHAGDTTNQPQHRTDTIANGAELVLSTMTFTSVASVMVQVYAGILSKTAAARTPANVRVYLDAVELGSEGFGAANTTEAIAATGQATKASAGTRTVECKLHNGSGVSGDYYTSYSDAFGGSVKLS